MISDKANAYIDANLDKLDSGDCPGPSTYPAMNRDAIMPDSVKARIAAREGVLAAERKALLAAE